MLVLLLAQAYASIFFQEDKICDPSGTNWISYTGYRIQRYASFSFFLDPSSPSHAIELYHCNKGKVDYVATSEVHADTDIAWGVDICGPATRPGQLSLFPDFTKHKKSKVKNEAWIRSLLFTYNPFHQTPLSNALKQQWLSNKYRQKLYGKIRKTARYLEELEKKADSELKRLKLHKLAKEGGEDVQKMTAIGRAIATLYSTIDKRTNILKRTKQQMQSLERFMNKGITVSDERALLPFGYMKEDGREEKYSKPSRNWRGQIIDLIRMSYASIERDYSQGDDGSVRSEVEDFDISAYRAHGSYLSNPSLSRLSSDPEVLYQDTPQYCFRAVRSKKYYFHKYDFYIPSSTIGGLFLCPAYGNNCTNENAIPVMPLRADNFVPVSGWGPVDKFQTSKLSAKRARQVSHARTPHFLSWLGSFAEFAGKIFSSNDGVLKTVDNSEIIKNGESEGKNNKLLANPLTWTGLKIKGGYNSLMSYFDDAMPNSLSPRRSFVNRVPFLYTRARDFTLKYEKDGTVVWPKWAKSLDVNEMYSFGYDELEGVNRALRETSETFMKHMGVWKQWEKVFDILYQREFRGYEEETQNQGAKSSSYFSRVHRKLQHSFQALEYVRKWTSSTVFSPDFKERMQILGFNRKRFIEMIGLMQKPWDELDIQDDDPEISYIMADESDNSFFK